MKQKITNTSWLEQVNLAVEGTLQTIGSDNRPTR